MKLSEKSRRKFWTRSSPLVVSAVLVATAFAWPNQATAAEAVRINAGGASQTVGGVQWSACSSTSACSGYVSGGNAWSENAGAISGVSAPDSETIEKSEWTGGAQNGVAWGQSAFKFTVPVTAGNRYDVKLHFTELNKTAAGQRVFDVKVNGNTVLTNFDIFKEAGRLNTIVKTFNVADQNGKVVVDFIRKTENAKVSAIEIVPTGSSTTTSSSTSSTSSTSTSSTSTTSSTTSTTAPPTAGRSLNWSKVAASPTKTVEATGGALGDKLYYFGGYLPTWLPMANAYSYSPATNSWERLPDMPKPLTHVSTVVDGRSFILAGGYGASGGKQVFASNTVLRYNVDTKQWSSLPNLPEARGSGGVALVGRTLHFMGGVDTSRKERSEHWTLDLDNAGAGWKLADAYPYARTHFALVTVGNSIYSIAGVKGIDEKQTELNGIYRYDTVSKSWSNVTTTPVPISHITSSSLFINGRIYIVTGEVQFGHGTRSVWSYDLSTGKWTTENSVPPWGRFSAVAGVINGSIYLAAGDFNSNETYKGTFS